MDCSLLGSSCPWNSPCKNTGVSCHLTPGEGTCPSLILSLHTGETLLSLTCSFGSATPGGSEVKASSCNAGDLGSVLGSGRSPGEGNGKPLQYSAWRTHGRRSLVGCSPWGHKESDTTERLHFHFLSLWVSLRHFFLRMGCPFVQNLMVPQAGCSGLLTQES